MLCLLVLRALHGHEDVHVRHLLLHGRVGQAYRCQVRGARRKGITSGWGFGWNPYFWGGNTSINRYTEGTLTIDLIDDKKKELVWQGIGKGVLTKCTEKKDENIKGFVSKILEQYPPQKK